MPASGDSSPFPTSPVDSPRFSPLTFMEGSSSSPSVSPTAALADAPITPHRVLLFPKPLALPRLPLASPSPAPSPPPLPSFPSSSSLQRPSPYPLRSSPSLPSFAAYTPLPPPGEKRRASQKSMIKTFTAVRDEQGSLFPFNLLGSVDSLVGLRTREVMSMTSPCSSQAHRQDSWT